MVANYRPPRNTICSKCYEGAKSMIRFLKEKDINHIGEELNSDKLLHGSTSSMGLREAFGKMKELDEKEEGINQRLYFAYEFSDALKEKSHTDILVQPGEGPAIPAHKALLATRSEIFKTLLTSDECKAPANDIISLPEFSYEELECFLEFLYSGSVSSENKFEKHIYALLLAADKYNIPFLQKVCEARILSTVGPHNALQVLEISEICSNTKLKEKAMGSIVEHMEAVILSGDYDEFAMKNAHLCVEITRALLMEVKIKRDEKMINAY